MQIKIFTLAFDEETEGFPDEIISEFCLNKKVLRMETEFFRREGKPYWSVAVHYELVLADTDKLRDLDDGQKLLFQRLKEWRKETGAKEGIPVYLIATNAQFIQMIRLKCRTLDSFKSIKGFGKQRTQKYGKRINELIKGFYELKKETEEITDGDTSPVEDMPF
ncbi:MAG TPA: HRDC domain-containing protein [Flavilitoribacter sp.]|nr:HRDC domain-containing protein [Flavilitoribacter sp.]HMQ86732.1 HRDC domain-containing protein [Flavilitoribacter sp.]